MSLSDSLVFSPKPSAVSSSKARWNQPSYNKSSFVPGEVIMINIPCGRRGSFLNTRMSYLKFRVTNKTAAAPIAPDFNIASIFQRLEVYHSSNLLEQVHEYGMLVNMWHDMTGSMNSAWSTGSLMEGNKDSAEREGEDIAATTSRTYAIPLFSGIVGVLQSKYLPTGDLTGGDLRVELTLANTNDAFTQVSATPANDARSWSVDNVELMLEYTDLAADAARMVSQQNSGGYMISFDSFANFSSSLEVGTNNCNILIPARYSSLKTIFTVFRQQSYIGSFLKKTITARVNAFADIGQWYFSVGGKNCPSTPVKTDTEAAAELYKALHAFGAQSHSSHISRKDWVSANLNDDCAYIIAQDFESQPHKSKISESGINTLSANTYLIGQFRGALTAALNVQSFAHYDGILVIQGGVASVQF